MDREAEQTTMVAGADNEGLETVIEKQRPKKRVPKRKHKQMGVSLSLGEPINTDELQGRLGSVTKTDDELETKQGRLQRVRVPSGFFRDVMRRLKCTEKDIADGLGTSVNTIKNYTRTGYCPKMAFLAMNGFLAEDKASGVMVVRVPSTHIDLVANMVKSTFGGEILFKE